MFNKRAHLHLPATSNCIDSGAEASSSAEPHEATDPGGGKPKFLRLFYAVMTTALAMYFALPVHAQQTPVQELMPWSTPASAALDGAMSHLPELESGPSQAATSDNARAEDRARRSQEARPGDRKAKKSRRLSKVLEGSLNIHRAKLKDWMLLPGIGEKKAQRIVDSRKDAPFSGIEDLKRVKGIGKKWLEANRKYLRNDGATNLRFQGTKGPK